jgi:hypothetical protein
MYGYATVAGVGGTTVSSFMAPAMTAPSNELESAVAQQKNALSPNDPFYIAMARGDTDGNGVSCAVLGLSHTNKLVVTNEGE